MFYEYRQNNAFGRWVKDEAMGIGPIVIIEADSFEFANARARKLGLYEDGVASGRDCGCCGDRWDFHFSEEESAIVPMHYSEPFWTWNNVAGFIHSRNGVIFPFGDMERYR